MGDLFKNDAPKTLPATAPDWVIDELSGKYQMNRHAVKRMGAKQAFAILYRMRERGDPIELAKERRKKLRDRLSKLAAKEDATADDFTALLVEGFVNLDSVQLAEVAKFTAAILAPPDPPDAKEGG